MRCLGFETSCDETAIALVKDGFLEDSVITSQAELHSLFGGVVPELASREHYRFLGPLLDQLLTRNGLDLKEVDIIAVARGPGLLGSLLVGMAFAKGLALALDIPLIGVNHLHAHLLATGLEKELIYPAIGLLVSGGHTQLYHIKDFCTFIQIGRTLDDAAGEAYDKTGHCLGLPYPAGKAMDDLGQEGTPDPNLLPHPYLDNDNLDFSFSGLKTYSSQLIARAKPEKKSEAMKNFCSSFNHAIAETLSKKVERALDKIKVSALWLAGGVAANSLIREKISNIAKERGLKILIPSPSLCTDNACMIAYTGYLLATNGFYHSLDVESIPRGRKIPDDMLTQNPTS